MPVFSNNTRDLALMSARRRANAPHKPLTQVIKQGADPAPRDYRLCATTRHWPQYKADDESSFGQRKVAIIFCRWGESLLKDCTFRGR
jgi:hypothetical protein